MSDSQTLLYNQALAQIGITRRIARPTEASVEAETCELYYNLVRRVVFSAGHWPSCRSAFRLNRLAEKDETNNWQQGDPQPGFRYAHALPANYVRAWYINNMSFFQLSSYVSADNSRQRCIVSNEEHAVMTYTSDETNIPAWEDDLYNAVMLGLAGTISYTLTRKLNKSQQLISQANDLIGTARAQLANAEEYQQERLAPWIAARGSVYRPAQQSEYIYPYGPLLSLQGIITDASRTT